MAYKDPKGRHAALASDIRYNRSAKGKARNAKQDAKRARKEDAYWRKLKHDRKKKFQENKI